MKKLASMVVLGAALVMGSGIVSADEPMRLESNRASLANVFEVDYGYQIWRWDPETEQGYFTLDITWDELDAAREEAAAADEPILIEQAGDISYWVLPTGESQVDSPMVDGAQYTFVF